MAFALSNAFHCPKLHSPQTNFLPKLSNSPPSFLRFSRSIPWNNGRVICASASAAGSSDPGSDLNPYEVLGVRSIEGFEMIKAAYNKKRKEAERAGDEATAARLEKAYDKVMMEQLTNRKKGVAYGAFKVSKDIKYADKQPIVPWGPSSVRISKRARVDQVESTTSIAVAYVSFCLAEGKIESCRSLLQLGDLVDSWRSSDKVSGATRSKNFPLYQVGGDRWQLLFFPWAKQNNTFTKSSEKDMRINMAISAVFAAWIIIKRNAEYKPLQFLAFAFVYRLFEKLKAFEPPVSPTYTEEGEDTGRALRMGKRLLRSLGLVFGCIAFSSLV
uniref:J domain-containing protein n=1 Tax=Fagus sylvatica TaxID=28930 RepID=A0A2N9I6Q3_FAGSY